MMKKRLSEIFSKSKRTSTSQKSIVTHKDVEHDVESLISFWEFMKKLLWHAFSYLNDADKIVSSLLRRWDEKFIEELKKTSFVLDKILKIIENLCHSFNTHIDTARFNLQTRETVVEVMILLLDLDIGEPATPKKPTLNNYENLEIPQLLETILKFIKTLTSFYNKLNEECDSLIKELKKLQPQIRKLPWDTILEKIELLLWDHKKLHKSFDKFYEALENLEEVLRHLHENIEKVVEK